MKRRSIRTGRADAGMNRTADDILREFGLWDVKDQRPHELSGGQKQRTALARIFACDPTLLLLDEPFSSLDENLREDMRKLVKDLHNEFNMTTILVTHDRQEALSMADRVALMFDGRIVQTGLPEEILREPADIRVEDYFGGNMYVRGIVKDGIFTASDGSGQTWRLDREDGEYELLLRTDVINGK